MSNNNSAFSEGDPHFKAMLSKIVNEVQDSESSIGLPNIEPVIARVTRQAKGDRPQKPVHNDGMEYVPRPELDAKIETIEARMDGRLARIEDAVKRISEDNAATRAGISSLKTTMIVTAIGAVLTIVLGVAAFNATLQSNMLSAFQVGQQTSSAKSSGSN